MLAGPVAPVSIILGKAIGAFVTGIVAMTVLIAGTTLLIGADWGPPLGVALIAGAGVLSAIGVATLVASFARTAETAGAASSAVAITLAIFGGSFSPVSQGPEIMSSLSLLTPHAWFLRGLADLHGAGSVLTDALPAVLVLLVIGLVTGGLGFGRARRLVAVG
jgi:ABC-2 type transport system permease protein